MACWMCGTEDPDDFTPSRTAFICDRCMDALDTFYDEAFADMRVRYKAQSSGELWESSFLEALEEYFSIKCSEFDRKHKEETKEWRKKLNEFRAV